MGKVVALMQAAAALSPDELEDFYQRISALRLLTGIAEPQQRGRTVKLTAIDWAERALYITVVEELQTALKRQPTPWSGFRHSPHYRKFRDAVEKVLAHNDAWCPGQDKLQKTSMLMLYGKLVVSYMMEGRKVGYFQHSPWRDVVELLDNLPAVVNYYFPGYAASGLLDKVATLRTARHR